MVKNFFLVIFISILIIGCDSQILEPNIDYENSTYYLNLESYLEQDENGYYHMNVLEDYTQTFTTLTAKTGSFVNTQKISWTSDKELYLNNYWIPLVNGSSYTDELGEAHTVFSGWAEVINDTITVFANYIDQFENNYLDSLKIIVE